VGILLDIQDVYKYFPVFSGGVLRKKMHHLKAVDGISFSVEEGSCFGIAGESGSGKTTIAKLILLLEKVSGGSIAFKKRRLQHFSRQDLKWYNTQVQTIFQDAASSLNPRMRIWEIVSEPLTVHRKTMNKRDIMLKTEEMLHRVGLNSTMLTMFPHELSGGQKQRVAIARAVILDPSLVVLDEPVSALDVSIRAQILNLLADIQEREGLTYLIIAHDLAMLEHITSTIAVMYLGKLMELGPTDAVYANPMHPYTRSLFEAVPQPIPNRIKERPALDGEIGNPLNPPTGCRFHPRCREAEAFCREKEPPLFEAGPAHRVACHRRDHKDGLPNS